MPGRAVSADILQLLAQAVVRQRTSIELMDTRTSWVVFRCVHGHSEVSSVEIARLISC
jgi:hypothetical protein